MTENLPESNWRSEDAGEIGDRREKISISAPERIWFQMLLETSEGSKGGRFVAWVGAWLRTERKLNGPERWMGRGEK